MRRFLHPACLVAVPLLLSFVTWAIPWDNGVRTGFARKEVLTLGAALVLAAWYSLILLSAALGYSLGRRIAPFGLLDRFPAGRYYSYLSAIGAIGVVYAYARPLVKDPSILERAVVGQTFNEIRANLEYGAGIQTLRYATILAAGIASWRIVTRRRATVLDVTNLVLLLAAAAIASRLSIILATLCAVVLFVQRSARVHLTRRFVLTLAAVPVVLFLVMTPLNYVRNANFYRLFYGTSNPFVMNAYEIIAYVGAPFQVSIGVANKAADALGLPADVSPTAQRAAPAVVNGGFSEGFRGWLPVTRNGSLVVRTLSKPRGAIALGATAGSGVSLAYLRPRNLTRVDPTRSYVLTALFRKLKGLANAHSMLRIACYDSRGSLLASVYPNRRLPRAVFAPRSFDPEHTWNRYGGVYDGVFPEGTSFVHPEVYLFAAAKGDLEVAADSISWTSRAASPASILGPLDRGVRGYLAPTYGGPIYVQMDPFEERYRSYVDVEDELLTNSAFADMYSAVGAIAFLLIALVSFVAGGVAGHAFRYGTYFVLAAAAILYCFAELWRTYLFNFGVIHFLVLVLVAIPIVDVLVTQRIARRLRAVLSRD